MAALSVNSIGDEGAMALASRLPQCLSLLHLNLGGKALAHGIARRALHAPLHAFVCSIAIVPSPGVCLNA
eukprot:scaffold261448_cov19-Prasinocladus_malaysianus.AAC.1